jgi:hypothetical protein
LRFDGGKNISTPPIFSFFRKKMNITIFHKINILNLTIHSDIKMNHTKLALVTIAAVAAFMIAATTTIPGHYAHAQNSVSVGGTSAFAAQLADNSQHASFGAGSSYNTATNEPYNDQTQTQTAGSTGTG